MTDPSGDGPEVLVAGAGPTGLVMASQLARHGLHVRIVDKNAVPSSVSKAIAVQARTLEVFDANRRTGGCASRLCREPGHK